jgi:hypothetical protein
MVLIKWPEASRQEFAFCPDIKFPRFQDWNALLIRIAETVNTILTL